MPAPGAVAGWPHQSCHSRRVRKCMCVAPASAPLELRAPAPQPEPRTGPPWAPALPPARPHAPLPRARQRTTSRRRVRRRPLARPQTHPKQRRHRRLRTRTRAASSLCGAAAHARETQHGRARSGALSGTWRSTVAPWFMHSHNGYGMDSADDRMGRGRTAAGCARWRCRRRGRAVQAAQQVQHGRRRGGGRCGTAAGARARRCRGGRRGRGARRDRRQRAQRRRDGGVHLDIGQLLGAAPAVGRRALRAAAALGAPRGSAAHGRGYANGMLRSAACQPHAARLARLGATAACWRPLPGAAPHVPPARIRRPCGTRLALPVPYETLRSDARGRQRRG